MKYADNSKSKLAIKKALIETSGDKCFYCGSPTQIHMSTIDHILPQAKGGSHDISNLAYCCKSCNSIKKNDSIDDFRLTMSIKNSEYAGILNKSQYKALVSMGKLQPISDLYIFSFEGSENAN